MSSNDNKPGIMHLPPIVITDKEDKYEFGFAVGGGGRDSHNNAVAGFSIDAPGGISAEVADRDYAMVESSQLNKVAAEIDATKKNRASSEQESVLDRLSQERDAIDALLIVKKDEFLKSKQDAEAFFNKVMPGLKNPEINDGYMYRYDNRPRRDGSLRELWESSYKAALFAKSQVKVIQVLTAEFERRQAAFNEAYRAEQLAQHFAAQAVAAEKAQRLAEQQAAEENARRLAEQQAAVEKARQLAEQAAAKEKAKRLAEQVAAKENARRLAEQKETEAKAQWVAEQKATEEKARRLVEQKAAEEKAGQLAQQKATQAETQRSAELKAAREKAQQKAAEEEALRFRRERLIEAMGAVDASLSAFGTINPAGIVTRPLIIALNSPPVRAAAVRAVSLLIKAIEAGARSADELGSDLLKQAFSMLKSLRTTFQGFGDYFLGTIPASDVVPQSAPELSAIAAQRGSISIPGWGGLLGPLGAGSTAVPNFRLRSSADVEVRHATFDKRNKTWSVAFPGNPGVTLIWTPIVEPINSSTALPGLPLSEAPYTGKPLTPIKPVISPLPAAPLNLQGLITVFPADSGLPPLFTVYNSPYPGATFKGIHSGRYYNPEKAGGPILNLSWVNAVVTKEGIALVKLHTGRLHYSAANDVMIARLEKILKGDLKVTDTDKRYYTHEIRELERYRAIGVLDGPVPDNMSEEVWNNAHAATLEDYRLLDNTDLLYTAEANAAYNDQIQKELKGI